jgi:hypothetical protein
MWSIETPCGLLRHYFDQTNGVRGFVISENLLSSETNLTIQEYDRSTKLYFVW